MVANLTAPSALESTINSSPRDDIDVFQEIISGKGTDVFLRPSSDPFIRETICLLFRCVTPGDFRSRGARQRNIDVDVGARLHYKDVGDSVGGASITCVRLAEARPRYVAHAIW